MLNSGKLGIIGIGVMGQAILSGLLTSGRLEKSQVWAAAKSASTCRQVQQKFEIDVLQHYQEQLQQTDVLLVCLKPNKILDVMKTLTLKPGTLVISIAAGVTLEKLEQALTEGGNPQTPVIRAMPNTPSVVDQGMTVLAQGKTTTTEHMELARQIFESVGRCMELDEVHFDAVTGLCGSGPAYMYLIMEALADGGVRAGLPRHVALEIVAQTVLGAATMVQKTGRHPASLRDDVTTPAGCTIAALLVMEDGKIRSVLARAVEEAAHIASQLG